MSDVKALLYDGWRLLSKRGRLVFLVYGSTLVLLAVFDAVALYLLAKVFNLQSLSESSQVAVDATASSLLLIMFLFCLRSVLSSMVTYVALRHGSREETLIGDQSLKTLIDPRTQLSVDGLNDFYNYVDRGPKELVLVIFHAVTVPCEALTALAIIGALLVYQPFTALVALLYFTSVTLVQQLLLARRSTDVGKSIKYYTNHVYQSLADVHGLRRLLRAESATSAIRITSSARAELTYSRALETFVTTVPRYFLELVLAVGLIVIGVSTFLLSGLSGALAATSLFVAAGFRLLPIVHRIQALTLAILLLTPLAQMAIRRYSTTPTPVYSLPTDAHNLIELQDVSFAYYESGSGAKHASNVLQDVSLNLLLGKQYALVGPSGAGKTTLVDLLLGLNVPQSGNVRVSPTIRTAYVPQETYIASLPLRQNVALQWSDDQIDVKRVATALERAGLLDFLSRIHDDTPLDPAALSGGQKQRIGLARALYTDANLFIFDEVTSALDMETEQRIYETVNGLRGRATVVVVAHRLSTVQRADTVFYLDNGTIAASGTFSELMESLPAFRRQIELSQIDITS